jgi:hypothetical protein
VNVLFHPHDVEKLLLAINAESLIERGDRVSLKVHMGEEGCRTYLSPTFVRSVADFVKELGAHPFVIDSPTLYPRKRERASGYMKIAASHGFSLENIGAEVVIGGGENGEDSIEVKLNRFFELESVGVIPEVANSDSMIVLTHVKGHILAKYGGVLKQLGMGCVSKQIKRLVHEPARPLFDSAKCIECLSCVEVCPFKQITIEERKASFGNKCVGCGRCIKVCPVQALTRRERYLERFYKRLMDASRAVLTTFEKLGKTHVIYLNFLINIYEFCDCSPDPGRRLVPDIGILASLEYPLPIEKASLDLIKKEDPSLFAGIDNLIKPGEEIGLGKFSYELEEVS